MKGVLPSHWVIQSAPLYPNGQRLYPSIVKKLRFAPILLLLAAGLACSTLSPARRQQENAPAPASRSPTATATTGGSASSASATPDTIGAEVLAQMEAIEEQVIELRGLQPTGPVDRVLIPSRQLRRIVEEDLLEDYSQEEAADDARLLALFGLLEPDFDLWSFYHDLYSEQIAGFYDDEREVMYVVQGAGFQGPERLTYAHEFVHALQDQTYDLDEGLGLNDEVCERDNERCAGLQALIEGDASLVEEQWLRTFATEEDIEALLAFYGEFSSPVFDSAPQPLKESFIFPYEHGLEFVRWLETNGGWTRVDEAYLKPPASTELILHPFRYPDDAPVPLAELEIDPEEVAGNWRSLDKGTLGEFDFRQILAQELRMEAASQAAEGWGGDSYLALYDAEQAVGAWVLVQHWDTIRDAQEAFLSWRDYADARLGERVAEGTGYRWQSEAGYAQLQRTSNQTLWLFAPNEETAVALGSAVSLPLSTR